MTTPNPQKEGSLSAIREADGLAEAKKERTNQKRAFTRRLKKLQNSLGGDLVEVVTHNLEALEKAFGNLCLAENQVKTLAHGDDYGEDDLASYEEKEDQYDEAVKQVAAFIKGSKSLAAPGAQLTTTSMAGGKLPSLDLPRLTGSLMEYRVWKAKFLNLVDKRTDLTDESKMAYLFQCVEERSAASITLQSVPEIGDNYKMALTILEDEFGDPQLQTNEIMYSLLIRERILKEDRVEELQGLYHFLKNSIADLESLKVDTTTTPNLLLPILETKIPRDMAKEWAKEKGKSPLIEDFFDFFITSIKATASAQRSPME
jgi:hypothetical protein